MSNQDPLRVFAGYSSHFLRGMILLLFLSFLPGEARGSDPEPFPYTIRKGDYYLTALSVATFISGEYLLSRMNYKLTVEEITMLDRSRINGFDRPATYNWSPKYTTLSDVIAWTLPLVPATVLLPQLKQKEWQAITTVGMMYLQVYGLTRGSGNLAKSFTDRTRPYLYNTSLTPEERFGFQENESDFASASFFSGHTAISFASATFLSKMYTDIYGKSTWSYVIWGGSLAVASVVAYSRVASGEHFPTDVLAGAAVGGAIGYLIPMLHTQKYENVSLSVLPDAFRLALNF